MDTQFTKKYLLWLVLALAGALRVWHVNWGLPELYEEAFPLANSWKFWNWGNPGFDFNPHFFHYPALTFYLNFVVQVAYFTFGYVIGMFPDLSAFQRAYETDPTVFILLSRSISVLFDIGTVYILFKLGKEIVNEQAGFLAGFGAAISPLLIKQAHLVNVDTPLAFFSILTILFLYRLSESPEKKWYIWSGISIGLAASSKYNGALLFIALTAIHFFNNQSREKRLGIRNLSLLAFAALLSAILFIMVNPFCLFSFDEFYRDFKFEEMHMGAGHLGQILSEQTWEFYFLRSLPEAMGWAFLLISICSLVYVFLKKKNVFLALGLFPIIYLTILCTWNMRAERYLLPTIPSLILLASIGLVVFWNFMLKRIQLTRLHSLVNLRSSRVVMLTGIGILLFAQPVSVVTAYHQTVALPDTRAVAKEWIYEHVPKGSIIGTIRFGMSLYDSTFRVFPIPFLSVNAERTAEFYDTRWFEDFDIIIGTSYDYDRYALDSVRYATFLSYYHSLRTRWNLVMEFIPGAGQPGPSIWLFQPPPVSANKSFPPDLLERLTASQESTMVSSFLTNLAKAVFRKGNVIKTEQLMREILSVEIHNMKVRRSLIDLLGEQRRFSEALEIVREYLAIVPDHAVMQYLQGHFLLNMNNISDAEPSLQRAIHLDASLSPAYDDLLYIYVQRRDKQQAIDVLSRHLAILPPGSEKARLVTTDLNTLRNIP